jgi:hypothetical protein
MKNAILILLLSAAGFHQIAAQLPRLNNQFPKYGRGGQIIKTLDNGKRVLLSLPKSPNMLNVYFNVQIDNLSEGDFYIQTVSDNPDKLPQMAVYRFVENDTTWCYAPLEDSATYRILIPKGIRSIQIASGVPYAYGEMLDHIDSLSDEYVQVMDLDRKSVDGNIVKVLKITDCNVPEAHKQSAWILGGQHVFETPALQTVKATIDFLASSDPVADSLRKRTIFYICPIVDVDASIKGLSGKRVVGRGTKSAPLQDLNWDWNVTLNSKHPIKSTQGGPNAYDNISHPQVKSLQELIYATASQQPLRFFIDHHSPLPIYSPDDDTLAFHIVDKYLPQSPKSYQNPFSYQRQFWDHYESKMGFKPAVLCDHAASQYSSGNSRLKHAYSYGPGEQFDYERSADYWVDSDNALYYRNTLAQPNLFFSTTVETGWYNTPSKNNGIFEWWDNETIYAHAAAMGYAMLQLLKYLPEHTINDRIIDMVKDRKTVKFKGEWKETAAQLPNTILHHMLGTAYATTQKGASVELPIAPNSAGIYDIFIWAEPMYKSPFNPLPNQCISDKNVQIRIFDGNQWFYGYVDQSSGGAQWRKITSIYLDPTKNPTLSITKISDNDHIVIADAIRITPSDGLPNAPVSYRD